MPRFLKKMTVLWLVLLVTVGCNSNAGEMVSIALKPPERKTIDRSKVGVNNFFVDPEFGSISAQYQEIGSTLKLHYVRVLFAWTDDVQASPNAAPSYGFFDSIISSIPPGVDVLIVLAHTPSWMANPANWTNGNPRLTWAKNWAKPTIERYAGRPGIVGWQIWNEPDNTGLESDALLELTEPARYMELLNYGAEQVRLHDPTRLVVMAATRSIQQNGGRNLDYNIQLYHLGAQDIVDVWAVHYYGKQYEQVTMGGGVADFLNSLRVPVWITESGEQGTDKQLAYAETTWPFLMDKIHNIQRIYDYQFGETVPAANSFGLRTTDPVSPVSDLYIYLRDN